MQTLRYSDIVMHIHDELVIEADPHVSLNAVCEQMGRTPPWAEDLKLRADGYETDYYKKTDEKEDAVMAEYRNSEGYADPTAYEAFRSIEKEEKKNKGFMPVVYICSPYAGDVEQNTAAAQKYCRFAVDKGTVPLAVHLLFPQFMSEETERKLALHMGKSC